MTTPKADDTARAGIIVGAAAGIGRAIAERACSPTTDMLLVDRDANVAGVAEAIGARSMVTDVTREGADSVIAEKALATIGMPDFLVYCAGVQRRGTVLQMTEAEWQALEETNWSAARRLIVCIARLMVDGGRGGSIVTITSSSVRTVTNGIIPYSVTKAALEQLTRGLAAELGQHGIRVNGVAPGYVRTAMTSDVLGDESFTARLRPRIPLGYVADPGDVAGPVMFLLSEESRYVTGAVIPVDGGFTLGAVGS